MENSERFWGSVKVAGPDECWEWQAGKISTGHGSFVVEGKAHLAHRWSLIESCGMPPADKPWALHTCDNRPCVNPSHLYWGSPKDNMRDMHERGRFRSGNSNKTHCPQGHPLSGENLILNKDGGRGCRECGCDRAREWARKHFIPKAERR